MWVCRVGKKDEYLRIVKDKGYLYLPWEHYNGDLTGMDMNAIKNLVKKEKKTDNPTSISNWAGQLDAFVNKLLDDDYVIIPLKASSEFLLVKIVSGYEYDATGIDGLHHRHKIRIVQCGIRKEVFSMNTWYSLRAYRTIFQVRNENEVLCAIETA